MKKEQFKKNLRKKWNFYWGARKNNGNFQEVPHNFAAFPVVKAFILWNLGEVTNLKIPGVFRNVSPQPPPPPLFGYFFQ